MVIGLASGLWAQEATPVVPTTAATVATTLLATTTTTLDGAVTVAPATPSAPVATNCIGAPTRPPASALFQNVGVSTNRAGMTITAERLEFDYKELVVAFDENVHVVDPQFSLVADRVLVFLEGTNQMKRIIALGNVDMVQTDRHATCAKAVYDRATGQVVMTGTPVLSRGSDRVAGKEIVLHLNDERVIVTGATMSVSPETMKNRDVKP